MFAACGEEDVTKMDSGTMLLQPATVGTTIP